MMIVKTEKKVEQYALPLFGQLDHNQLDDNYAGK